MTPMQCLKNFDSSARKQSCRCLGGDTFTDQERYLVELLEVAGENEFVVLLLQGRHGHAQDALILGRQALLHILDHTP